MKYLLILLLVSSCSWLTPRTDMKEDMIKCVKSFINDGVDPESALRICNNINRPWQGLTLNEKKDQILIDSQNIKSKK
jgi:hypothetical protein